MRDTLIHTIDSVGSAYSPDSLAITDTLTAVKVVLPSGMEGIIHPSTPAHENWIFLVIAVLFFLLVLGIVQSAGVFTQSFKAFFSRKDSANLISPTANVVQFQLFITLFSIFVFALAGYELIFNHVERFQFKTFLFLSGAVACFYILKHLLFEIVGHTFFDSKVTRSFKNLYFGLLSSLAILLFPILILYTYQPASWHTPLVSLSLILVLLFYTTLIIKIFQIFYTKPVTLFYIFLYLCMLELLPILTLFRVCEEFILMF